MPAPDFSCAVWRKSSRSNGAGNCVEVAVTLDMVGVRDSKNSGGPLLAFDVQRWAAFLASAPA